MVSFGTVRLTSYLEEGDKMIVDLGFEAFRGIPSLAIVWL